MLGWLGNCIWGNNPMHTHTHTQHAHTTHNTHTHTPIHTHTHAPIHTHTQEEYLSAVSQESWNRRVDLSGGEAVIMHSTSAMVQYPLSHFKTSIDHEEDYAHPKSVLRGFKEVDKVEQGKSLRMCVRVCGVFVCVCAYV